MNDGWRIAPLSAEHDRSAFACGHDTLDRYLKTIARQDRRRDVGQTFVLTASGSNIVVGYYTLAASSVALDEFPPQTRKKLPRYERIPAALLGRLAVDRRHQGQRLGPRLLVDALRRVERVSAELPTFAVVVDAIDAIAVRFYQHHGFAAVNDDPQRLFLPLATIRQLDLDSH